MPDVLPFRGIRYAASRAATLSRLIAPPYDSVSPAFRDVLAARSPHNLIHVTLGKDEPGDGPADNKYLRAAQAFERWLAEGTVRSDPEPALYPLEQSFTGPDGRPRVRRGLIAACRPRLANWNFPCHSIRSTNPGTSSRIGEILG